LIELMITVAIVAILAAVALPIYRNYAIRGQLVAETNALASFRALMEQYYQDNRQYTDLTVGSTTLFSPCDDPGVQKSYPTFTLSCPTLSATAYVAKATALSTVMSASAAYTVDNLNNMVTTAFPASWNGGVAPSAGASCWLLRQAGGC